MKLRPAVLITAAIGILGAGAIYLGVLLKADQGDDLTAQLDLKQKPNAQIALDTVLVNEDGKSVKVAELFKGRPMVINLIFYNCRNTCSRQLEGELRAFTNMKVDNIGEIFDVLTVSIHPEETPALAMGKKRELLKYYQAARPQVAQLAWDNWHFMTGSEKEVTKLAQSLGIKYTYNKAKGTVVHPTVLTLATPDGRISSYFEGDQFPNPLLRNSILFAGQKGIAPSTLVSILGCFTYDTKTGKTMFHVQSATQLLGALTLLTMIVSIFSMNKRFKQEHAEGNNRV
ncbi:MAG: SCO family protein [Fimbriimonadaceae bacterium]